MTETAEAILYNDRAMRGNPLLKPAKVEVEWTPELLIEYEKCANEETGPLYFCNHFVKIVHLDDGLIQFHPREYQEEIIRTMHESRYTIVTTGRQVGKTTSVTGYLLWYVLFHGYKDVAILANKEKVAHEILERLKTAYVHLPKWLQQGVIDWNKGTIGLENGSRVVACATSSDAIRGYSISILFIDEAAHIENWSSFYKSTFPTISSGKTTKIVLVSTPKGLNHFYKIWEDSKHNRNNYKRVLVTWDKVPGRDEEWKKNELAAMSNNVSDFEQEHCCEFVGSSGTLIAGSKLKALRWLDPIREDEYGLKIYKPPEQDHRYACTLDSSEGKGLDFATFHITDITRLPYEQVATFRSNNVSPVDHAEITHGVLKMYNDAVILVEYENMGPVVAYHLHDNLEYENVLYTCHAGTSARKISISGGAKLDKGLKMSQVVKKQGCSLLKLLIEQDRYMINDFDTIEELNTFSKNSRGSYSAEEGKYDDMVMPLVVFAWLTNQEYFKEISEIDTLNSLRDRSEVSIMEGIASFGFVEQGERPAVEEIETVDDLDAWLLS